MRAMRARQLEDLLCSRRRRSERASFGGGSSQFACRPCRPARYLFASAAAEVEGGSESDSFPRVFTRTHADHCAVASTSSRWPAEREGSEGASKFAGASEAVANAGMYRRTARRCDRQQQAADEAERESRRAILDGAKKAAQNGRA